MIPYGRQQITDADIRAVVEVLESDFLTQGPVVPAFEREVARYCGIAHAVASNSATSALHVACLALGVRPGDRVWTSAITFAASANCARYCGAEVDFVDVDPITANMSVTALAGKLTAAERSGTLPKVVIPVHLCGQSCDMAAIHALGQRYGFLILEDASHAFGGRYRSERVGSCRYSDVAVFSYHPVKIITTGEGGVAVTADNELARRMQRLRNQGLTREPGELLHPPDGGWYYEQIDLGFNYRMTDIAAALGLSQLKRVDELVAARRRLAERYGHLLAALPVTTLGHQADAESAHHLYVVRLPHADRTRHAEVFGRMRDEGIGVNLHYIPVYRHPYYRRLGFGPGHCAEAEAYYAQAITLPLYPDLTDAQQDRVVEALRDAVT